MQYRDRREPRRSAHARPDLGSTEDDRLATLHLQFAIGAQGQIALGCAFARLRVINRSAFPLARAAGEAPQHDQPLDPPIAQRTLGVLDVALVGVGTQGSGVVHLAADGRAAAINLDPSPLASVHPTPGPATPPPPP